MNEDDRIRENALLDLFIHPGWKLLLSEMREAHQALVETAHTVKDERELYKRKGEIQKLGELLTFEDLFKLQMSELHKAEAYAKQMTPDE